MKVKTNRLEKRSLTAQLVSLNDSGRDWIKVWHAIVNDHRVRAQVRRITVRMIDESPISNQYINDITQDVYLLLAAFIRGQSDLGYQPERGRLRRFLDALIRNFIREAARDYINRKGGPSPLPTDALDIVDYRCGNRPEFLDLHEQTDRLHHRTQTIALMYLNGYEVGEIATIRKISTRTVYRHLNIATSLLRSACGMEPIAGRQARKFDDGTGQ